MTNTSLQSPSCASAWYAFNGKPYLGSRQPQSAAATADPFRLTARWTKALTAMGGSQIAGHPQT
jgi:hypothetical protein